MKLSFALQTSIGAILARSALAGFCYSTKNCKAGTNLGLGSGGNKAECIKNGGKGYKKSLLAKCEDVSTCKVTNSQPILFRRLDGDGDGDAADDEGIVCGEPHFKTWSGSWYDYHGECDLVLIQAPKMDMEIHIRTKIRYNYSYIETAALRLGEDVLEVSSFGDYFLNGVSRADLSESSGAALSDYPLSFSQPNKRETFFVVKVSDKESITLHTFKDWVSVKIKGFSEEHLGGSLGLLGLFETGELLDRTGEVLYTDPNAFGEEWQVLDTEAKLFQTNRAPQYPQERCILPSEKSSSAAAGRRRRLGQQAVTKAAAEDACNHWGKNKNLCVADVMMSGDLEFADSIFLGGLV